MDASTVRTESFTAAFMLGMKEYFGNVDHLRATVSEVPVPDADYKKQYLVISRSLRPMESAVMRLKATKLMTVDWMAYVLRQCTV